MDKKKKKKVVDINHLHVFLAHADSSELKATALQHGMHLVRELTSYFGCSMAKGIHAPTPHQTTFRAAGPIDMVHIDTAGIIPGITGRLAICRHVRGQRFSLPAPVRGPGQERIYHSRCGKTFRRRHGSSASI